MRRKEQKDSKWSRQAESWHRREVAWVSFFLRGFLLSGKLWVINVEDHAAHCRIVREIITRTTTAMTQRHSRYFFCSGFLLSDAASHMFQSDINIDYPLLIAAQWVVVSLQPVWAKRYPTFPSWRLLRKPLPPYLGKPLFTLYSSSRSVPLPRTLSAAVRPTGLEWASEAVIFN